MLPLLAHLLALPLTLLLQTEKKGAGRARGERKSLGEKEEIRH